MNTIFLLLAIIAAIMVGAIMLTVVFKAVSEIADTETAEKWTLMVFCVIIIAVGLFVLFI